jgi:amino acid transporter
MAIDDSTLPSNASQAARGPTGPDGVTPGNLRGNLGTLSLIMTVIAYNGPLIALAGSIPLMFNYGNGLATPVTFLVLGVLVAVFAVGINAMATRMTHAGAFYTYITAGLGRPPGLAGGLIAMLAYLAIQAGCLALFGISVVNLLSSVFGVESPPPWQVWAFAAWAIITVLSLFNIELSAKVVGVFSCAELIVALVWNARVYINGGPDGRSIQVVSHFFDGSLPFALVLGIGCVVGFESLQVFRAESKDPVRTVPRATYCSVAIMAGLYTVSSYTFIVAWGPGNVIGAGGDDPTGSFLLSVAQYVSKPVADIANVLLSTSTFAACLAIQMILSRYLFSFGKDRVLPAALGEANARFGSPMRASLVAATVTGAILALPALGVIDASSAYGTMVAMGTFCLVLLYLATSIAIVVFFARRPGLEKNKLKVVVAPTVASLGMATIVFLTVVHMTDVLGQSQTVATICLLVVLGLIVAGLGAALWFRSNRPDTYAKIGRQTEVL